MKKHILAAVMVCGSLMSAAHAATHEAAVKQRLKKAIPSIERRIASATDPEVKRILEIVRTMSLMVEHNDLNDLEHEFIKCIQSIKHAFLTSVVELAEECPRLASVEDMREIFGAEECKFVKIVNKEREQLINKFMGVMNALHPFMLA